MHEVGEVKGASCFRWHTQFCNPNIFATYYQRFTPSGCKVIEMGKKIGVKIQILINVKG